MATESAQRSELVASVYAQGVALAELTVSLPLVVGRQNVEAAEPPPFQAVPLAGRPGVKKLIVEKYESSSSLSRSHVQLEPAAGGAVRLTNLSKNPVAIGGRSEVLQKGEAIELPTPIDITLGHLVLSLRPVAETAEFAPLAFQTLAPGAQPAALPTGRLAALLGIVDRSLCDELLECLRGVLLVMQQAAGEADFFQRAARSLRDVVGLHSAATLLYDQGQWRVVAFAGETAAQNEWQPSRSGLAQVVATRRTLRSSSGAEAASMQNLASIVVAPILDAAGEVIGALYGDRRVGQQHQQTSRAPRTAVTEVEALLADMLASAVAAGILRLSQEQRAIAHRVRLEQFFTPVLAQEFESNPDLMLCKEAEITALVCDVRGFSGVSEQCGPAVTLAWLSDTMDRLGRCVIDSGGVLVDQIGDEFLAMWGAPHACADHAARAMAAVAKMQQAMPALNANWCDKVGRDTRVGFGLNSGLAIVGNTGSQVRFRYAPLGDTVNLASRLQGSTKFFQVEAILAEATARSCNPQHVRRLGKIRVVNRAGATEVYEYRREESDRWRELRTRFEQALVLFEKSDFRAAIQQLGGLIALHPDDGPSLLLLSRCYQALSQGADPLHPVWTLPGK